MISLCRDVNQLEHRQISVATKNCSNIKLIEIFLLRYYFSMSRHNIKKGTNSRSNFVVTINESTITPSL